MLRIIKNYFWNIASIILIIIIAESVYFYHKINAAEKFKTIQQSKVSLTCKIAVEYPEFFNSVSFCSNLNQAIMAPIHSYILSYYSLKKDHDDINFKAKGLSSTFTINFEIEKNEIIKFNEKDFETYVLNKVYNFFDLKRSELVNHLINLQERLISDELKYPFENEEEIKLLLSLKNQNIKEILSFIKTIKKINQNQIVGINFEYNLNKEFIKNKFSRLNYTNILLISLLFGIYLNIIVIVLMQNNLLKN